MLLQVVLLLQELMQLLYSNLQYEISRFHKAEPKDNTNTTDLPGLVVIADLMQTLLLLLVVPTLLRQTSAKHRVPVLSKAVCFTDRLRTMWTCSRSHFSFACAGCIGFIGCTVTRCCCCCSGGGIGCCARCGGTRCTCRRYHIVKKKRGKGAPSGVLGRVPSPPDSFGASSEDSSSLQELGSAAASLQWRCPIMPAPVLRSV